MVQVQARRSVRASPLAQPRLEGGPLTGAEQVRVSTSFVDLLDSNPWLKSSKLVVKPDMLFGKRGKHDLVGLNLDTNGVERFIKERMGKVIDMDGCVGGINTFVVEPFVPHDQEFYLCIQVLVALCCGATGQERKTYPSTIDTSTVRGSLPKICLTLLVLH